VRQIEQTKQFKRDLKRIASSGRYKKKDLLDIIDLLISDKPLSEKNRDHSLINDWQNYRECHIKPDWLLIYKKYDSKLLLARTGTHSELF
jgi:mRNA interferase YafQ